MSSQRRRQPAPNKSLSAGTLPIHGFRPAAPSNNAYTQASFASNNPAAVRGVQGTTFRQFARPARRPDVPPPVLSTGTRIGIVERQTLVPPPTQSTSASSIISPLAQLSPANSSHAQHSPHSPATSSGSNRPSVPRSTQPVSPQASRTVNFAHPSTSITARAYMRPQQPRSSSRSTLPQVSRSALPQVSQAAPAPANDVIDLTGSPSPSPNPGFAPPASADYMSKTVPTSTSMPNSFSFPSSPAQIKTESMDADMDGAEWMITPEQPRHMPTTTSISTTSAPPTTTALASTTPASAAPAGNPSAVKTTAAKRGRPSTQSRAPITPAATRRAPTTLAATEASPVSAAKRAELLPADVVGAAFIYADVYKRRTRRDAIDQELIDTKVLNATLSGRLEVLEKLPGGPQDAVVAALTAALAESHSQVEQLHGSLDDCEGLLTVYRNACWHHGIAVNEETGDFLALASAQPPDIMGDMDPMDMMTMNAMDVGFDSGMPASTSPESTYTWDTNMFEFSPN